MPYVLKSDFINTKIETGLMVVDPKASFTLRLPSFETTKKLGMSGIMNFFPPQDSASKAKLKQMLCCYDSVRIHEILRKLLHPGVLDDKEWFCLPSSLIYIMKNQSL